MDTHGESCPHCHLEFRVHRFKDHIDDGSEKMAHISSFPSSFPSLVTFFSLRPTCQWFKDGVKLTEKSHQINNKERTLTFKSASPDDNGLYYCCAKNAAGHVCSNSNFTISVTGVCVSSHVGVLSLCSLYTK